MQHPFDLSVYLITDPDLSGARSIVEVAGAAIAGGATMIQLRDPGARTRQLVDEARALVALARPHGVAVIVNDRVDIALAADADGVHVGQSDMTARDARALIGPGRILGLSITREADLDDADLAAVDYLGVGPIYATLTKPDAAPPMAIGGLAAIVARVTLPIVAIGGLHAGNAVDAIQAGADGVAVVSAICAAADPEAAARELAEVVGTARRHRP